MIPIHQLLSRIRWDREFSRGDFEIGYYDRVIKEIIRVPFSKIIFETDNRSTVQIMDSEGTIQTIPLHRIKEVSKNGQMIWQRKSQH